MNFPSSRFELGYKTDSCLLYPVSIYLGPPSSPLPWAHYYHPHWHTASWVRRCTLWSQHTGGWDGRTEFQASLSYKTKACLKNQKQTTSQEHILLEETQTVVLATIKPQSDGCYHFFRSTLMPLQHYRMWFGSHNRWEKDRELDIGLSGEVHRLLLEITRFRSQYPHGGSYLVTPVPGDQMSSLETRHICTWYTDVLCSRISDLNKTFWKVKKRPPDCGGSTWL